MSKLSLLILTALTFAIGTGCKPGDKKPAAKTGSGAKVGSGSAAAKAGKGSAVEETSTALPQGDGPLTAMSALSWAPASADAVIALTDLRALYGLLGDVERAVSVLEGGAAIMKKLHQMASRAPLPLPWKAEELAKLGLDPAGTIALVLRKPQAFLLLPLKSAANLKEATSKLGRWSEETLAGISFAKFTPRRGRAVYCYLGQQRASCSASPTALAELLKAPKRQDPVYARLDAAQKKAVGQASAFFWLQQRQLDVVATARVTVDGLQVVANLNSLAFAQASKMLGPLLEQDVSQSPLLGLAVGSTSRAYLRLPLAALARLLQPSADQRLAAIVGDATNFTGEILALERPGGQLAIVLGTRDMTKAQAVVETLGKAIRKEMAKPRKKGKDRPQAKLTAKRIAGRAAFLLDIKGGKTIPMNFRWGIAAGPLGIVAGSYALVEKIAQTPKADAAAFLASLSAEDRAIYGKGALAGLQLAIGDPLQSVAGQIDKVLPATLPPMARAALSVGRFLMDQLDHISFGQAQVSPQKMRLVAGIHTLHRRGNADDDAARKRWHEALVAKFQGNQPVFEKGLLELATKYPKTRYAQLKDRQQGALFTTMTGVVAAVAIPAFMKYTRRARAVEGRMALYQISTKVRMAITQNGGKAPKGDSGWTPAKPCCKQPKGRCVLNPADWSKPPWKALGFQPGPRSAFQYRYQLAGKTLTLSARADFDCDGTYTLYQLPATLGGGRLQTGRVKAENEGE